MGTPDIGARENFIRSVSQPTENINLALACLYIAAEASYDLDVTAYLGRISEIAEKIRPRVIAGRSTFDSLYELNGLLFDEMGFRGNVAHYYDIRNSLINEVLDRKIGIPITLSVLYMEIGKRIGIPLTGINAAGHFLLSSGDGDSLIYIDPFRQGRIYSRWECLRMLHGGMDPPSDSQVLDRLEQVYLPRTHNKIILARLLNNMKLIYTNAGRFDSAIAAAERINYLLPWNWHNIGDIAYLHGRAGRARDAYDMLARMVQMMPPHEDVSMQMNALKMLKPFAEIGEFVDPEEIRDIPFFRI